MADKPAWKIELEEKARMSDDPALDGVVKIAESIELQNNVNRKQFEAVDKKLANVTSEVEQKIAKIESAVKSEVEKIGTTMEAGFGTVMDKFASIDKRNLILGNSAGSDPERALLEVLGEGERKGVTMQDVFFDPAKDKDGMRSPIVRAACDRWFRVATMAQHRRWYNDHPALRAEKAKIEAALQDYQQKAAYTHATAATGANAVPDIIAADILRIVRDNGLALNVCRTVPMASDTLIIPNQYNNFTAKWATSQDANGLTSGETTIAQNILNAMKVFGRATASTEAVEDIVFNLLGYLREVMGEEIARLIDVDVFEGTGTVFTGLVTETGVNSVATTTTDGDALEYKDLVKAVYAAYQASTRQNAAFVMHPAMFAAAVGLVDTNGQPIFQYANVPNTPPERVLGYPAYLSSALSIAITRGATGNTGNIYFGPLNKLILGIRRNFEWAVTDQVNWASDSIDCRMIGRFGFTVGTPAAFTKIVGIKQLS